MSTPQREVYAPAELLISACVSPLILNAFFHPMWRRLFDLLPFYFFMKLSFFTSHFTQVAATGYTAGGLVLLTSSVLAQSDIDSLDSSVVNAQSNPVEIDSLDSAIERVSNQSGAASIIEVEGLSGRIVAPEQLFQLNPQVFARSRGLANDTRISIRGSGIQRAFGDRGLTLLIDGIPANDADGSFYFRAIDPLTTNHVEVFAGANGLAHGGAQLGGAVNIVQKNGITDPGAKSQFEVGSNSTYRTHLSYGGERGLWDYFFGYSYAESDGYRERQGWDSQHITANAGYHWSDAAVTRFYLLHNESDGELTGSLSPSEFAADSSQAGANITDDADRDLTTFRIGQRTQLLTDGGKWSFYSNYQYLDFDHLINEGVFRFNRLIDYEAYDVQVGLRGSQQYQWAGVKHTVNTSLSANIGSNEERGFTGFVTPGNAAQDIVRDNRASNVQFYLENDSEVYKNHHFIVGAGYVSSYREVDIDAGDETGDSSGSLTDDGVIYRVGYLYKPTDDFQIFSNYSQSFESSPFAEVGVSLDPASGGALDPQIARTFEVGTRYANDWADFTLSLYRADVSDEFVDEEIATNFTTTTNLDTVHQGIEASLTIDISEVVSQLGGGSNGPKLYFDQSYQFNDFKIDEGLNDRNRLPGVSRQVYAGRIRLEDRDKRWSASLSADWLPEGYVVDNANTTESDGFVVWKLAAEVKLAQGVSFYAGVDNLFDEEYVTTVSINPSSDVFINPGDERTVYAGMKFAW